MKKNIDVSDFKYDQLFGSKDSSDNAQEEDLISIIKFNKNGQFLALGDHAGRVIIFKNQPNPKNNYEYFAEFQSHVSESDYLKGCNISQQIKSIEWLHPQGKYLKVLTSNSKTIKLWKVYEKQGKRIIKYTGKDYSFPKFAKTQSQVNFQPQKIFPNLHSFPIIQTCLSANQNFLLSSDSFQSFLWNLQKPEKPYIVNQIPSQNTEDQCITCLRIHPTSDNLFCYGTNRGSVHFSDIRCPLYQKQSIFISQSLKTKKVFEDICKISGVTFLQNGRHIAVRDYLKVKIWDITNTKSPLLEVSIEESLKTKLCELFQQDCTEDKFQIKASPNGRFLLTGNYNNCFHMINTGNFNNYQYQLNYRRETLNRRMDAKKIEPMPKVDIYHKTKALDFHPTDNIIAVASKNSFFTYSI